MTPAGWWNNPKRDGTLPDTTMNYSTQWEYLLHQVHGRDGTEEHDQALLASAKTESVIAVQSTGVEVPKGTPVPSPGESGVSAGQSALLGMRVPYASDCISPRIACGDRFPAPHACFHGLGIVVSDTVPSFVRRMLVDPDWELVCIIPTKIVSLLRKLSLRLRLPVSQSELIGSAIGRDAAQVAGRVLRGQRPSLAACLPNR